MNILNSRQNKLLYELSDNDFLYLDDVSKEAVNFLIKLGYARLSFDNSPNRKRIVKITEEGKAFVATLDDYEEQIKTANHYSKASIVISILALVVSIVSVLLRYLL